MEELKALTDDWRVLAGAGAAVAVAIIAASSKVDLPFVMTMQIGRAIVAILIGPALARFLARWAHAT